MDNVPIAYFQSSTGQKEDLDFSNMTEIIIPEIKLKENPIENSFEINTKQNNKEYLLNDQLAELEVSLCLLTNNEKIKFDYQHVINAFPYLRKQKLSGKNVNSINLSDKLYVSFLLKFLD